MVWRVLEKVGIKLLYDPAIQVLVIHPEESKNETDQKKKKKKNKKKKKKRKEKKQTHVPKCSLHHYLQ